MAYVIHFRLTVLKKYLNQKPLKFNLNAMKRND